MTSINNIIYMMKFDFHEPNIKQYSKVKIITCINNAYLVKDIITNNRCWVMKYDIYPLNIYYDTGVWSYSSFYDEIAKKHNLL